MDKLYWADLLMGIGMALMLVGFILFVVSNQIRASYYGWW